MRGFPKRINTKQDVLNLLLDYPDETKDFLRAIIDQKELFYWKPTGEVESGSDGVTDSTHKVVIEEDQQSGSVKYTQMELVENPFATVYRLGFSSVEEVEDLINGY